MEKTTEEKLEIALSTLNTIRTLCTGVNDSRLEFLKGVAEGGLKQIL